MVVVVGLGVAEDIGGAVLSHDGDAGGLIAGDGGGAVGGEGQAAEHQRDAGDALLHGDGAALAAAGYDIGTGGFNGQGRAVDVVAGVVAVLGGDGDVGEGEGGGPVGIICGTLRRPHTGRQQGQQHQRRHGGRQPTGERICFGHTEHPFFKSVPAGSPGG